MLCKTGSSWASLPTGLHVHTDIYETVESITVAGLANSDLRSPQWNKALFFPPRLVLDQSSQPPSVRKALTSPCPNTESVAWTDSSPLFDHFVRCALDRDLCLTASSSQPPGQICICIQCVVQRGADSGRGCAARPRSLASHGTRMSNTMLS